MIVGFMSAREEILTDTGSRGWMMDVLNCVNSLPSDVFTAADIYQFEAELKDKHPKNNYIRPKIRQQLQVLRDNGFVQFLGNGNYVRVKQ